MMFFMDDGNHHVDPPANGAGVVTYNIDLDTGLVTWSDSLYTVFGYDRSEQTTAVEWLTHHIHPNDAMGVNEVMDMLIYPWVKEWTVYYRFQMADHTYVLVHDRVLVIRDQDGKALRMAGTIWL